MLPIRQTILAIPQLGGTSKAVLIEVCQLAEAAGGWCRATNPYLATALGSTERTITRQLMTLEARGLLQAPGAGKARRLAPTPTLRACYLADTEPARAAALAALNHANLDTFDCSNLDTMGTEPRQSVQVGEVETAPNLDTIGAQPRHNGSANLDTIGAQPRHNGSRVLGDQQDHQLDQQHPLGAGERWELQKKIGDLQAEVQHLKAQLALAKAPPVAGRPPAGYRDFEADWPENLTPPFQPPAFRAAWATYAAYAAEIGKPFGPISEKQALADLGRFAAGNMQRALGILSHNITQRYRTLTNDDGTQTRKPSGPGTGSPNAGRVSPLPAGSYGRNRGPAPAAPPAAEPADAAA